MSKTKYINWFVSAFCGVILICSVIAIYWLYFPYNVIEWKNADGSVFDSKKDEIVVLQKTVQAGDIVPIEYSTCRYVDGTMEVNAQLINGTIHTFSPVKSNLGKGCRSGKSTTWVVPKDTPSGKYRFVWTYTYPVNPIRIFLISIRSQEFFVENPILDKLESEVKPNGN